VTVPTAPRSERWELYKLLAEPARLRLLALTGEDELAVSELADLLGESQPNVSRHAAPLRQAGLLSVRRQGTWTLMRLAEGAAVDPVVADALGAGRALCQRDGTLPRVADVVRARERRTREFFARPRGAPPSAPASSELTAYLAALAVLLPERALAVDAGTGEGRSLELLAPLFQRVVAVDRAEAQLEACRERVRARGFANVSLVQGELDGPEARAAVAQDGGADLVLAARVLHHAPRPAEMLQQLAALARPGGAVVVIDYERHEDEALREQEADLWLGFEPDELLRFAHGAGLEPASVSRLPAPWYGAGPDRHLVWQALCARRPRDASAAR
jgi:DNA-binding transcriptional ArsR family regulator/protein-L-isoaspartate O-methyltransferase